MALSRPKITAAPSSVPRPASVKILAASGTGCEPEIQAPKSWFLIRVTYVNTKQWFQPWFKVVRDGFRPSTVWVQFPVGSFNLLLRQVKNEFPSRAVETKPVAGISRLKANHRHAQFLAGHPRASRVPSFRAVTSAGWWQWLLKVKGKFWWLVFGGSPAHPQYPPHNTARPHTRKASFLGTDSCAIRFWG